jgi:hypothetical protein
MTIRPRAVRPGADEHEAYYSRYVGLAPDGDVVDSMTAQIGEMERRFRSISPVQAGYSSAPGKWTLRRIVGHLTDTERVFAYRATHMSRADAALLPSFDQDAWNPFGSYDTRTMDSILDEWIATRRSTIALADALPDEAWDRRGVASGFTFTVRACLWILPGHVRHHLALLEEDATG